MSTNTVKHRAKQGDSSNDSGHARGEPQNAHGKNRKRQPDGSAVVSPPSDPVNSEETLKRNRIGNS